ncbi:MAG: PilZ domain-containing protein [Gemmataceae bacterium]|nr:PilZ domain-containing protein [Gemmataceae bacterium]
MSNASSPVERRRTPRRQPALGTILRLAEVPAGETDQVALVWNISIGGVSFLYPRPFSPGTELRGDLVSKRAAVSIPVVMRVTHSVALQTGDYVMGCQFREPITAEQMGHFVDEALVGL